ncbi:MAG: hypothetical protein H6842_09920 [Rhodospirillaceae bacterium]|nr:hypothetical protein [Rhodospirillaceae bacterium]
MRTTAGPAAATAGHIHRADCSIWDTPDDARPEAIAASGLEDEAVIAYLGTVRPIYDALGRVLGQLSGLLLLASTGGRSGLDLDRGMYRTATGQLGEAAERLRAVRVPAAAARHHARLAAIAETLGEVARALDRAPVRRLDDHSLRPAAALVDQLSAGQRLLISVSEPRAGMTPVDFSGACCSCGAKAVAPATA